MKYTVLFLVITISCASAASVGLSGDYYNNTVLGGLVPTCSRIDPQFGFTWSAQESPCGNVSAQYFSVRWLGSISVSYSDSYWFSMDATDGVRLWVNDHLVIDDWNSGEQRVRKAAYAVPLDPDTLYYPIRIEFFRVASQSASHISLLWASGRSPELEPVPSQALNTWMSPAAQTRHQLQVKQANSGWGTHSLVSMTSFVLLPHGMTLTLGLYHVSSASFLANIQVFGLFNPASVRPGRHSYSNQYMEIARIVWQGMDLRVEAAQSGSDLLILATPYHDVIPPGDNTCADFAIVLSPSFVFNPAGQVSLTSSTSISMSSPGLSPLQVYSSQATNQSTGWTLPANSLVVTSLCGAPVAFVTGSARSLSEVLTVVRQSEAADQKEMAKYGAGLSEAYQAMRDVLAWNTIFNPLEGLITPVSRGWDFGAGYVLFEWDNFFGAWMLGLDNKELAYSNIIQVVKSRTVAGLIPNWSSGSQASTDRTEPPVGAQALAALFHKYHEEWLVDLLWGDLVAWNDWFWNTRTLMSSQPLSGVILGSTPTTPGTNDLNSAKLESGLDNSPLYDTPAVDYNTTTHLMNVYDIGMSALYAADTLALSRLLSELSNPPTAVIQKLESRYTAMVDSIRTLLREPTTQLYINRHYGNSTDFVFRVAPTSFYVLLAEFVPVSEAEALVTGYLTNSSWFCVQPAASPAYQRQVLSVSQPMSEMGSTSPQCPFAMPSISRNDVSFADDDYWRGRIWAPMNFLVHQGLAKYGNQSSIIQAARQGLCEQALNLLLNEWRMFGHVHENYEANTGTGCNHGGSDPFYHWGALNGFISLLEAGLYS
eukprot:TRINITY_DN8690_c0_g1_i7.p1 TRINITY_DN8690_c0_g1~~TRINITY_DN8690_c0_g1_i7.p1  ORF type:complete len:822 (+),score=158.05 TRINITY_DN8690_c0_g1_i7:87-2552(+)